MKKLLPILLIFQIFCIASFAQEKKPTKQETINWLSNVAGSVVLAVEKPCVKFNDSYVVTGYYYDNKCNNSGSLSYKSITGVRLEDRSPHYSFHISGIVDGKQTTLYAITLTTTNKELPAKFLKAIIYLAKMEGATIVDDDLF